MTHPVESLANVLVKKTEDANERKILVGSGHRADLLVWKDADGNIQVENLSAEKYVQYQPHRKAGTVRLHDSSSFVKFISKHKTHTEEISVYAVMEPTVAFVAVLNDHGPTAASFRDHRAVFMPRFSAEWETWLGANGRENKFDGNAEFSRFLLDNCHDVLSPAPADMLSIAANFRAVQSQTVRSDVRLHDGNAQFTFDNVVRSETVNSAGQTIEIPERFSLMIPVFDGLDQPKYELTAMLSYRIINRELQIWFDLLRHRKVLQQAFSEMCDKIATIGAEMYFGTPE